MVFFLVFVILFSTTIMYLVEKAPNLQVLKYSGCDVVAVMTVTTVATGIYPVTPLGQTLASVMTLAGVSLLALPSAILATGFIEEAQKIMMRLPALIGNEIELIERLAALKRMSYIR